MILKIEMFYPDTAVSHASAEVSEKNTVITVPLEFNATQRSLVTDCATKAGFNVAQVISEPAAACLAYGLGQIEPTISNKCLVFQCGAMTLTVSIVLVTGGMITVQHSITKKVGGDEVTDIVVEQLAQEFKRKYKEDPRESKKSKQKLRLNAENVKHVLSTLETANCYIESLFDGIDFNANVSRSRFDNEFSKVQSYYFTILQYVNIKSRFFADVAKIS
jgi:molecular chaperone DnaK (HSP70)